LKGGREVQDGAARVIRGDTGMVSPEFLLKLLASYKDQVGQMEALLTRQYEDHCGAKTPLRGFNPFLVANEQKLPDFILNPDRPDRRLPPDSGCQTLIGRDKPDPNVKLEPGPIELSTEELKAIERLVPPEFRLAKEMGLGEIRIGYSSAGVSDELVLDRGKVVHPGGDVPKEIKDSFPLTAGAGMTILTRYGKIFLTVRGTFVPSNKQEAPCLIFSRKMTSPGYFFFTWLKGKEFQLLDKDRGAYRSLPDRFNDHLLLFKQQLAGDKGVETDPGGVKRDRVRIAAMLEGVISPARKALLDGIADQYNHPGGNVEQVRRQVSGARLLLLHFLCLGCGDWLAITEEGKALQEAAKALKSGDDLLADVGTQTALYLNPLTRGAKFRLAAAPIEPLAQKITELLGRHSTTRREDAARLEASFGHHRMVDETVAQVDEFIALQAIPSVTMVYPAALPPEAEANNTPVPGIDRNPSIMWWSAGLLSSACVVVIVLLRYRRRAYKA
jgi:hypothetical protein